MQKARNNTIDAAKLLGAFGVVMIHLAPSTPNAEFISRIFSCFVVPFFLMIALYFFIEKVHGMERLKIIQLRFDRILIPYVVWTIVYLVFHIIKYQVQHKSLALDLVPALFYGGTGVQMYFLPLLLLFQAQVLAVLLIMRGSTGRLVGILVLIGATVYGYYGSYEAFLGFQNCLERGWVYIFFAFFLYYSQSNSFGRRINLFLGGMVAALAVGTTIGDYHAEWLTYIGGPLAGYSIAALSLNIAFMLAGAVWRFVLSCSYGIYLAHFVFLETFEFTASRLGHEMTPYSVLVKVLLSFFICSCCVILIWFARLNRISAYSLLGETNRQ
jgi:peptidoglycan/LPS O-acetylase OafA/YrhL